MDMKFRCERDKLLEAMSAAGRAVTARSGALPVLSGVRLELTGGELLVTGSDLDLTISVSIEVAGSDDGLAVIPSKLAADVVRALPSGAVEVSVAEEEANIVAGSTEFTIRVISAEEYPNLIPDEGPDPAAGGSAVTIDGASFRIALRQVVPAASKDEARPILTGVLMVSEAGGLRLVSTDSYRLAVKDLAGTSILDEDQKVLVPGRALDELARIISDGGEVSLRLAEREASFEVGNTTLTTRLIEGDFPNYRGLLPSGHPNKLTVDREALLEAVRRVRLLAQESTPVRMAMSADGLSLTAATADVGKAQETLEASYEGSDLTVAFNPQYLIDGIEVTPGPEISLETMDELKPALLRSVGDEDFLYLLMPVRVS